MRKMHGQTALKYEIRLHSDVVEDSVCWSVTYINEFPDVSMEPNAFMCTAQAFLEKNSLSPVTAVLRGLLETKRRGQYFEKSVRP